ATAHQEVVKGPFTEYSGAYYAVIIVGEWLEFLLVLLIITLFVANPWLKVLLFVGSLVGELLLDNACARLNWKWLLRYSWAIALPMAVIGIMVSSDVFRALINALSAYIYIGG
ncbi:MAG TPA: NADH-quinone oxidoreductase subunit H, partial [Chroococcales cyanobacterium]